MHSNKMYFWNTNSPGNNKVQIGYFKYKGHDLGHKVIDLGVTWKGFISWVCIPYLQSLSLMVQNV